MSRLRSRRFTFIALIILALFGGINTGREIFFQIAYSLIIVLLLSFLWAWNNMRTVSAKRLTRTRRTQVGKPLEERFRVRNDSVVPKLWIELRDFSELPGHFVSKVVSGMPSRSEESWRANTLCEQRGRYRLGPMILRTSDPFGLFTLEREVNITTQIVVFPHTVTINEFPLPQGVLSGGEAIRRKTHFVTTNAAGLREYAPGDSLNRIHWPSTARHNRLLVKEFELDPLADVWIMPDMAVYEHADPDRQARSSGRPLIDFNDVQDSKPFELPRSTEEYTVTIAASLAQYFLRIGRSVGMLAHGQINEIVQPDRGERQSNKILEMLSVLRAEGEMRLTDLVMTEAHLFPRGSTLIVVTPTTRPEWSVVARQLQQRGLRVVTVLVNPASFGSRRSSEILLPQLKQRGMGAFLVNYQDDIATALSSAPTV